MLKKSLAARAAKSKKRAQKALLQKYKNQIYNLVLMLISDEKKAESITFDVFSLGFLKIKNSKISEDEEFYKTVSVLAVQKSLPFLDRDFKYDSQKEDSHPLDIEREKYVGEADEGYNFYSGAFSRIDHFSQVLIILYFGARLNEEEIGRLLKIKRTNIIWKLKTAVEEFSEGLQKLGAGGIRKNVPGICQLRSFYREYARTLKLPDSLENKKRNKK